MANLRENEMIKHSGNKMTKQAGRQNYKTAGKRNDRTKYYDFLPKKNVLSIFDVNERKRN